MDKCTCDTIISIDEVRYADIFDAKHAELMGPDI